MASAIRRSPAAQIEAMRRIWPHFVGQKLPNGLLVWGGALKPKAQEYKVIVYWKAGLTDRPFVCVHEPRLRPRPGIPFNKIPHLMFDEGDPENSALCLFDPDGREWSPADLIAETTIKWAAEWLLYYELWHLTGEWLGPGVGYESVGQMKDANEARAVRAAINDVH